ADVSRAIRRGLDHHRDVDLWFHRSAWFHDGERDTRERLRRHRVGGRHMALFAHPLWEMALDGALLTVVGASPRIEVARACELLVTPPFRTIVGPAIPAGDEPPEEDRLAR